MSFQYSIYIFFFCFLLLCYCVNVEFTGGLIILDAIDLVCALFGVYYTEGGDVVYSV